MHTNAYPIITPDDNFKSEEDPDLKGLMDFLSVSIMKVLTLIKNNLHYILPAVLLNPVLFLHAMNAVCTVTTSSMDLPNMLSSFVEPWIDINNNFRHAVAFTIFITVVQLKASQRSIDITNERDAVRKKETVSEDEDSYWEGDSSSDQ